MEHLDTPYGNDRDGKPTIYVSPRTSVAGLVGRVCKHLDKAAGRAAAGKVTERMQGLAIGGTASASGATGAENGKIKASASSAADVAADTAVEAAAAAVRESEIWLVAAGRAMDKLVRAAAALLAARPDAQVAVFTGSVRATDDIIPVSTSGTSHAKRFARASSDDGRHAGNDDASWETEPEQDQSDADPNRMEIDGDGAEDEDLFGGGGAGAAAGAGDTAGFESSSRTRMVGVLEVQVRLK